MRTRTHSGVGATVKKYSHRRDGQFRLGWYRKSESAVIELER